MADEAPPIKHPQMQIENVHLERFERIVYSRKHEEAGKELLQNLRRIKAGAQFMYYPVEPRLQSILYTRFCAAVISLLADPMFNLSQDGFDFLASEHATMDTLFRASVFDTSDHLLPQVADNPDEPDRSKLKLTNGQQMVKFLLTYSLRSPAQLNFKAIFQKSPRVMLPLWTGMISSLLTTAINAQKRREELLGLHELFADVDVPDAALPSLSDAYMYASYCLRRDKHAMKGTVHALIERMMVKKGAPIPTPEQLAARRRTFASGEKPTMLIPTEWWTELHAMFRCYAPQIRQLRERFRLVGMGRAQDVDDVGKAEFDHYVEIPEKDISLSRVVEQVNEIAPDVIYYPSIGMALWWVVMASLRLAPVQLMSLGHPASTRSRHMDYVVCDEGAIGDPSLFSEEIAEYPNGCARFLMRRDGIFPEPLNEDDPEAIHIAVPAMLCKINATFMATMRRIRDEAGRPTRFHFFVNMLGVNLYQAAREIRDWLPESFIYERTSYVDYLDKLRKCHVHCCTFPFGGTNSNIDSMLLGIPLVALWGDEPHERFDGMMLRRAQMPEWTIAKSVDEYVAAAVRLVDDTTERNRLRDHLRAFDLQGEFFGSPPAGQETAFADAIWRCYAKGGRDAV